jgi:hypothetical protein
MLDGKSSRYWMRKVGAFGWKKFEVLLGQKANFCSILNFRVGKSRILRTWNLNDPPKQREFLKKL